MKNTNSKNERFENLLFNNKFEEVNFILNSNITNEEQLKEYKAIVKAFERWENISSLKNPSKKMQLKCLEDSIGKAIEFIKNPSEEVQMEAIKQDEENIYYLNKPSEEVQLMALELSYGKAFKFIDNPSKTVQLMAVRYKAENIEYIEYPNSRIQQLAVRQNPNVIKYIEEPTKAVQEYVVREIIENDDIMDNNIINKIKNPSEELQLVAVKRDITLIEFIEEPTEKVQEYVVNQILISNKIITKNVISKITEPSLMNEVKFYSNRLEA